MGINDLLSLQKKIIASSNLANAPKSSSSSSTPESSSVTSSSSSKSSSSTTASSNILVGGISQGKNVLQIVKEKQTAEAISSATPKPPSSTGLSYSWKSEPIVSTGIGTTNINLMQPGSGGTGIKPLQEVNTSTNIISNFRYQLRNQPDKQQFSIYEEPDTIMGYDVGGYPVTFADVKRYSPNAPDPYRTEYEKLFWARSKLTTRGINYGQVDKSPYLTKYGYSPDTSNYSNVISNVESLIGSGKESLTNLMDVKSNYPQWKSEYEANKKTYDIGIETISKASPSDSFYIDVDKSGTFEPGELFKRDVALEKFKQGWIISEEGEYKGKSYDVWFGDVTKAYEDVDINIQSARVGLVGTTSSLNILRGRKEAGYELKIGDNEYSFSLPSSKAVAEKQFGSPASVVDVFGTKLIVPNIFGASQRAMGAGAMEAFPTIIPIRTMVAGGQQLIFGGNAWKEYEESLYEKSLNISIGKGESIGDYSTRFWHPFSESGVGTNIYLPVLTMGAGYGMSALSQGGIVSGGSRVSNILSKVGTTSGGQTIGAGFKGIMGGVAGTGIILTGGQLGYTAAVNPSQLGSQIGYVAQGWGQGIGGWTLGSYLYGGNLPTVNTKTSVTPDVKTNIKFFDIRSQPDTSGNIGIVRHGTVETIVSGQGKNITYKSTFDVTGQGRPIGNNVYVTEATGYSIKGVKGIFEGGAGDISYGNLMKSGNLSKVEAYGISEALGGFGKTTFYYDVGVSGSYGKVPSVTTSKGFTWSTSTGTTTLMAGDKNVSVPVEFETSFELGQGVFKSNVLSGQYKMIGKSFTITKGVGEISGFNIGSGQDIIGTGESSKGVSTVFKDLFSTSYHTKPVESDGFNIGSSGSVSVVKNINLDMGGLNVQTVGIANLASGMDVSAGMQTINVGMLGSTGTISLKPSKTTDTYAISVSSVKPVNAIENYSYSGLISSGTLRTKTDTKTRYKSNILSISETSTETERVPLTFTGLKIGELTKTEPKTSIISGIGVESISMKRTGLSLISSQVLGVKTKYNQQLVLKSMMETQPYTGKYGISIFTPILGGGGTGGVEPGVKTRRRTMWGFGRSGKVGLKTALADPFSVMESQVKYGKATHKLLTKAEWSAAERSGWRIGTVEMKKGIKLKTNKIYNVKKKKKRKR